MGPRCFDRQDFAITPQFLYFCLLSVRNVFKCLGLALAIAPVKGAPQPDLEMNLLKLQNQVLLQQLAAQGNQLHPQQAQAGGDGRGDINQLLALGPKRYLVV